MDDMYAILYSNIYIFDAKNIKIGRFKQKVTTIRHVDQSALSVWFYGTLSECHKWLENFYNNINKDKYKDIECKYDEDKNLCRIKWNCNLNTYKYDSMQSLYISKLQDIFNRKEDDSEN